jgi:hypothetical protein
MRCKKGDFLRNFGYYIYIYIYIYKVYSRYTFGLQKVSEEYVMCPGFHYRGGKVKFVNLIKRNQNSLQFITLFS